MRYCSERKMGSSVYELQGGNEEVIKNFKLPKTYFRTGAKNSLKEALIYRFLTDKRVSIDQKHCSLCKKCRAVYPAGAISWSNGPVNTRKNVFSVFAVKRFAIPVQSHFPKDMSMPKRCSSF